MSDLSKYLQTEFRDHSTVRRGQIPEPMSPDMGRVLMGLDSLHLRGLGPQSSMNPVAHLDAREPHLPEEAPIAPSGGGLFAALRRVLRGTTRSAVKN